MAEHSAECVRLLREARRRFREDEDEARANLPWSQSFFDYLAEVDEFLRQIDGKESGPGDRHPGPVL